MWYRELRRTYARDDFSFRCLPFRLLPSKRYIVILHAEEKRNGSKTSWTMEWLLQRVQYLVHAECICIVRTRILPRLFDTNCVCVYVIFLFFSFLINVSVEWWWLLWIMIVLITSIAIIKLTPNRTKSRYFIPLFVLCMYLEEDVESGKIITTLIFEGHFWNEINLVFLFFWKYDF